MGTDRLKKYLESPVSPLSLEIFRVITGLLFFIIILRFFIYGWIDEFLISPRFLFPYFGFAWLPRPEPFVVYGAFFLAGLSALGIMTGLWYRWSAFLFFLCFTYTESLEKTIYLNHYYFVSLLSFCMIFLPAGKCFCLSFSRERPQPLRPVAFFGIVILRIQIGSVYFFAGIAKIKPDWLSEGLPLGIWLRPWFELITVYLPVSSEFLARSGGFVAAVFDLCVPFLLWNRSTRLAAYGSLILFHTFTWYQFHLGMFPVMMSALTLIFFPPDWPGPLLKLSGISGAWFRHLPASVMIAQPVRTSLYVLFLVFFGMQALLPFRHLLYQGNVLWTEQGFRFSWNVMLMEKNGYLRYRINEGHETRIIYPEDFLSPLQYKMVATQPDMILQLAHKIRDESKGPGVSEPAIFADSFVSLNGRPSQRFIDPDVNLSVIGDQFFHKSWIIPESLSENLRGLSDRRSSDY